MAGDGHSDLWELVEAKMKSSLSMDNAVRQTGKCNLLPFTLMSLAGHGDAVNFFQVPEDNTELGLSSEERPQFGVVTANGCVMVYDTMFRRIAWKQQTNTDKVSWGCISMDPVAYQDGEATILIQSRQDGLHLIQHLPDDAQALASKPNSDEEPPKPSEPEHVHLSHETHIAFCKPFLCSDGDVLVPVGLDKLGLLITQERVTIIHTFPSTIMAIREVGQGEFSRQVMCTLEDGSVNLLDVKWDLEKKGPTSSLLSTLILPTYRDMEQQPIGICIEGCEKTFVVGTSTKYIFIIKWIQEDGSEKLVPSGKKILPTEGVSCVAMREGKGLLAAGCFDGSIRLFSFPDLNRISTINFHSTQINALQFVNEKRNKTGRWYLLCSANESIISVWNIPSNRAN